MTTSTRDHLLQAPAQERYRVLRTWLGYSQAEWASLFGVSQQTVSAIENRRLVPSLDHLSRILLRFGLAPRHLGYHLELGSPRVRRLGCSEEAAAQ
jgi:DNA-binding XRE family transcriptional regulator